MYRKAQNVVKQRGDRSVATKKIAAKEALQLIGHNCRGKRKGEPIEFRIGK